ncbi:MAG: type IV pilin protein [Rhodocyclales bacterium GT-UBC]|nr:MAG: type IV pilin protein [Rhodocyclales bacterium GT-UBC]
MNNTIKQKGFTLIELMIVVVVISILAAVAVPSYRQYVAKSRRTDAKSALLATSQAMEKFYTEKMTYDAATLGTASTDISKTTSPDGYYTIRFDSAPTGTVCSALSTSSSNATAYRICATPTGSQTGDACGILSIDNKGVKLPATAGCWR